MFRLCYLTILALLLLCQACSWAPTHAAYREQYAHLKAEPCQKQIPIMQESDYFLVLLVEARHLDYSDCKALLKTVAKHPDDGCKSGDVGHAWIYLQGVMPGTQIPFIIEGGHSGELGVCQAKYLDGVMNYIDFGYANPSEAQCCHPRYEPNPIKYLWEPQQDGFFQKGSGGHVPTYAAKIHLNQAQFFKILNFIRPENYNYSHYSLTEHQCSTFIFEVAALADFFIEDSIVVKIDPMLKIGKERIRCWEDPIYRTIQLSTPDVLERDLMQAVREGRVEYALDWYFEKYPCRKRKSCDPLKGIRELPSRLHKMYFYLS